MDEGLVAWGAAAIAAVSGVGGTLVGGWQASRAQRSQTRQQAEVDHEHWHRERRLNAYLDLLAEWDRVMSDGEVIHQEAVRAEDEVISRRLSVDLDEVFDEHWNRLLERLERAGAPMERIVMLAPQEVVAAVQRMRLALKPGQGGGGYFSDWSTFVAEMAASRRNFMETVRADIGPISN